MEHIKKAIAQLDGDEGEIATAFLVSKEYLLTARHTFVLNRDETTYKICFQNDNPEKEYTIENIYFEDDIDLDNIANDIAILKLSEPINDISPLALDFSDIKIGQEWKAYGYPGTESKRINGEIFKGTINDIFSLCSNKKFDLNLHCEVPEIIDGRYGIKGASGSPIIRNGAVVAVFSNESPGSIVGAATIRRSENC